MTDRSPNATSKRVARTAAAWLAHGVMFGLGYVPDPHRPRRSRALRTVVFVHGLAGNRANFLPLRAFLAAKGHRRQIGFNYSTWPAGSGARSIESVALRLKRHLDRHVKGGSIDLVCHSMGGLVARFYLQQLGGARRVERLVTLGTPHHGSTAAAYVPSGLIHQLAPGGAFLKHLNSLPPPPGVSCHAFAAEQDRIVSPTESAFAPFGENRLLEDLGHMDMLLAPRVFRVVAQCLAQPPSAERVNRVTPTSPGVAI